MAITVRDCLNIGVLREATLAAGAGGLGRSVESVTVMEFNGFKYKQLENTLTGNEMAITAFAFLGEDPEEWVEFFHNSIRSGVSCFVVFYFGWVAKQIPPEVIRLADQEDIPILLLSKDLNYAYSDLIMTVCEALISDRRASSLDRTVVTDILNRILGLDLQQQNIQTLLEQLSQRTRYNLVLTDTEFSPFAWSLPELETDLPPLLSAVYDSMGRTLPLVPQTILFPINGQPYQVRFQPIRTNKLIGMLLILQPAGDGISIDVSNQIEEVVALFLQFWRLSHGHLTELELRLDGDIVNVRPKKYQRIVVIGRKDGLPLKIDDLQFNRLNYERFLPDGAYMERAFYKGTIVLAGTDCGLDRQGILDFSKEVLFNMPGLCLGERRLSDRCPLRTAYYSIVDSFSTAAVIFPTADLYSEEQVLFAEEIVSLKKAMGSRVSELTRILQPLREQTDWEKLFLTLATTYLDCGGTVALAAKTLHVHENTIKYRIGRVRELLDLTRNSPVNDSRLILALAIQRALQ